MRATLGGKRAGGASAVCLGAALVVLGSVLARPASACEEESVRVLVARSSRALTLGVDGRRHRIEPTRRGLRIDGGEPVARWRTGGQGVSLVNDLQVHGRLDVLAVDAGLIVVNEVPLERYVEGVLAGEIPSSWAPAALRSQAVVSRSYALHQRMVHRRRAWHVEADTRSQVYAGAEAPESVRRAVRSTRCEVLTHGGLPILAAFHSASGGRTASAEEVWGRDLAYLVSREVTGEDDSPDTYWRARISARTLGRALGAAGWSVGDVREAEVVERSESDRVRAIRFRGTRGDVTLSGRQLREALGESTLRSTLFELRGGQGDFVFVGSGSGHGVGMSQWGARALAQRGEDYRSILEAFYPGTALVHWRGRGDGPRHVDNELETESGAERSSVESRQHGIGGEASGARPGERRVATRQGGRP